MIKVLIWDNTGDSPKWCETYLEKIGVEIVQIITPSEPVPEILLKHDAWDWLLIFEKKMRISFDTTIRTLNLPLKKIIYALDVQSWLQKPKAIYSLFNDSRGGTARRWFNLNSCREVSDFIACTVEGLNYVATAKDDVIMRRMFVNRYNFAADEMKRFQELSKQYYNIDESSGYFLDLGANIGTTGIYFCKKLAPNLKLLAFEPDSENFKLHRINLILNDMDSVATLVNCGLGDKFDKMTLYKSLSNPGGNSILKPNPKKQNDIIKIVPLDAYLSENKIAAQDVKYIWIDTEGFESQVLLGAKNLLRENPAPVFMECNLLAWENSGRFDDMMALLAENYSHFIHIVHQKETLYPLEALRTMERPNHPLGQIGDIFLIRKGAIV